MARVVIVRRCGVQPWDRKEDVVEACALLYVEMASNGVRLILNGVELKRNKQQTNEESPSMRVRSGSLSKLLVFVVCV